MRIAPCAMAVISLTNFSNLEAQGSSCFIHCFLEHQSGITSSLNITVVQAFSYEPEDQLQGLVCSSSSSSNDTCAQQWNPVRYCMVITSFWLKRNAVEWVPSALDISLHHTISEIIQYTNIIKKGKCVFLPQFWIFETKSRTLCQIVWVTLILSLPTCFMPTYDLLFL